jgi:uncharacterized protein GlcG (DUF336 family)
MQDSDAFEKKSVGSAIAQRMTEAGVAKAWELGNAFTIAFVDESGVLRHLERMDGAPLISVQIAQDKAYTAAGFGIPSHGWYDFIKDDPPIAIGAREGIDRLVIFGGGLPVTLNNQVIGAVGVSGGHYSKDMEVGQGAIDAAS